MNGSGLAILEAGLVDLRYDEMRALGLDSLEYGLLHNLRQVRSHYNWSNLIKTAGALSESLLQWD